MNSDDIRNADEKRPQASSIDKARWAKSWDEALQAEEASDEYIRQRIEKGRQERKKEMLDFLRQWRSQLIQSDKPLQTQDYIDKVNSLSAKAAIVGKEIAERFDELCDAVRCASTKMSETSSDQPTGRNRILDALAALVNFIERT